MSATLVTPKTTSGGEIIRELVNASDGAGLHFDGAAGSINGTSNLALGSKYSAEFVINYTGSAENRLFDINGDTRFIVEFNRTGFTGKIAGYDSNFYEICDIPDDGVFHLVVTVDGTAVSAYVNGNLAGTATKNNSTSIDTVTQWTIGANVGGSGSEFEGTIYRARFYNHTLSADEVRTAYERADVDFSSQYGSQTNKISGAVDKNWGTNQADTGNDANDRATFNTNYVWHTNGAIIDISVVSNVLQFTTASANQGVYYPSILTGGKKYRVTIRTGTITGDSFKVMQYDGSSLNDIGTLVASTTNVFEFTADSTTNGNLLVYGTGSGTLQINAASVDNEVVAIGCVSDYQTQWANPTQSLTVQDASGNADGTCSASGVTQVQPVVQLNSTSARIGTSTATPADGAIIADKVGAGVAPAAPLHAKTAASTGFSPLEVARLEVKDEGLNMNAGMGPKLTFYTPHTDASFEGASIAAKKEDAGDYNEATSLTFSTCPDAGTNTERLTIDSSGHVIVANMPTSSSGLASGTLYSDGGTIKIV